VQHLGIISSYKTLIGKPQEARLFWRPKHRNKGKVVPILN